MLNRSFVNLAQNLAQNFLNARRTETEHVYFTIIYSMYFQSKAVTTFSNKTRKRGEKGLNES